MTKTPKPPPLPARGGSYSLHRGKLKRDTPPPPEAPDRDGTGESETDDATGEG